ncbi:hypothetical protein BG61_33240 [Caballeronia glathei]|uniref:Uncharacterized protein n=1 Tax=Caballeronia glathei TaxID=60547 RepID=A0A069PFW0_9BURK|nr:hypothetical protein BG61_33240 [Caballeronia glathei]
MGEIDDIAMFDHDALGRSGGSGGIDHIGEVAGIEPRDLRIVIVQGVIEGHGIEYRQVTGVTEGLAPGGIGDEQHGGCVPEHVGQSLGGIGRIERHIGGARFENGQQRYHQLRATLHAQCHARFGTDAQRDQLMGEPVGLYIEMRIGEGPVFKDERDRIGRARDLMLEQLVDALLLGEGGSRVVPSLKERALTGQQQWESMQRCVRLRDCMLQKLREPLHMRPHCFGGVKCCAGIKHQSQPRFLPLVMHVQCQVIRRD